MGSNSCGVQAFDGKLCMRDAVKDGKCFWHSDIPKTDTNARQFFPSYANLKEVIEKERPNLEKADFTQDNLEGIDFHELNLRGAYFDKANLYGAIFIRAHLESSYLNEANLEMADLTEANLTKAALAKSNLKHARLDRAILQNTRLNESNLSFASLRQVVFHSTKLHFVNLYQADLSEAKFSNRESQLKFCNIDEPKNEDYFERKILEWIEHGQKVDVLRVLEFYQKRLSSDRFQQWNRKLYFTLEEKLRPHQKNLWVNGGTGKSPS